MYTYIFIGIFRNIDSKSTLLLAKKHHAANILVSQNI